MVDHGFGADGRKQTVLFGHHANSILRKITPAVCGRWQLARRSSRFNTRLDPESIADVLAQFEDVAFRITDNADSHRYAAAGLPDVSDFAPAGHHFLNGGGEIIHV